MPRKNQWQAHYANVARMLLDVELDTSVCNRILGYIGDATGASSGAMAIRDRASLVLVDPAGTTWPGEALGVYMDPERPLETDPVLVELTRKMFCQPAGHVFSSRELLDPTYQRTRFFHEFGVPFEIPYLTGTCFNLDPRHVGSIFFHRPLGMPEFDRYQRRFLEEITVLISLALRVRPLQRKLIQAEGALDRMTLAVIMLDEHGYITHLNRHAARFIENSHVLEIRDRRVRSKRPKDDADIERACREATSPWMRRTTDLYIPDEAGRVRADSPRSFTQLIVLPLSEKGSFSLWRGRVPAVMFLSHSRNRAASLLDAEAVLRRGFGCSRAMARHGALYSLGMEAEDIAREENIKECTVRKNIGKVYIRTGSLDKFDLAARIQSRLLPVMQ